MLNRKLVLLLSMLVTSACGENKDLSDDTGSGDTGDNTSDSGIDFVPESYAFESAFFENESSVSYSGQVLRQVLMADMRIRIGLLSDQVENDTNGSFATPGTTKDYLAGVYYTGELLDGSQSHLLSFSLDPVQTTYDEISVGKNLMEKTAGNDTATDHKDWSTEFRGWNSSPITSPESLILHWLDLLDSNVVSFSTGGTLTGLDGFPVEEIYLTEDGMDLRELLDSFLSVTVAFSQGADDYLDDDVAGKGLNSNHLVPAKEGASYTALEHAWDEGFGYFGAARNYGSWTDEKNASAATGLDYNGDGYIDLEREVNWGQSVNAANRDLGCNVATDFTSEAWEGFAKGRQLLANTAGRELTHHEFAELQAYRDQAVAAWENVLSATVIHYINAVLQDLDASDLEAYSLATHWSKLKGLALGFQFNPRSPLSGSDFITLHSLLGDAPSLSDGFKDDLLAARELLGLAYSFDAANLGDVNGEGGW